ncbi:hypothetical protein ABZ135_18690 [Streptomyces sp. NPDC006339]|uniref:hypothetical protein n=1 Tax=Streptomyces sp. NPDC006339 TaxID=3156755 RepID=UPI0033AA0984
MKKILTTAALTSLALAGGIIATAGTAAAESAGNSLPPSLPLSDLLDPAEKPAPPAEMPAANRLVGGLLPGQH